MLDKLHPFHFARMRFVFVRSCPFSEGIQRLVRQSSGRLEDLSFDVPLERPLFEAIAECGQLKYLSMMSSKCGGKWPLERLAQLERVHLNVASLDFATGTPGNVAAEAERRPLSCVSGNFLQPRCEPFAKVVQAVAVVHSDSDYSYTGIARSAATLLPNVAGHLDTFERLRRVVYFDKQGVEQYADTGKDDWCVEATDWHLAVQGLCSMLEKRSGMRRRDLTIVLATSTSQCAFREFYSLLPAIGWQGAKPTPADDDERMGQLTEAALAKRLPGFSLRRVPAGEDSDKLEGLPRTFRSERQFQLTTAYLSIQLVLLPDYNAHCEQA